MNPLEWFRKQFRMEWNVGNRWSYYYSGRTRIDYRAEIGDGRANSIVQACILWFCRNFPEAPLRVSRLNADGEPDPLPNHPLKLLLDTPNAFYSGELLWWGTLADWCFGNAYWLKIRNAGGRPLELWWVPSSMIEPKWPDDGSAFISHYEYSPNGDVIRVPIDDVVHFRYGLDPRNPRKGLSPLGSLLREVYTDEEAGNYSSTMLRNVGVPSVLISPGPNVRPTQDDLDEVKQNWIAKTTGERRGEPMIMRGETNVQVLGFAPEQMNLRELRGIPEERISAMFGIPAAVVGLGSGLANTKVGATMREMREQAYENMVIPSQRLLAAELRTQLLDDFGNSSQLRIDFDLSQVRVLQEDQNALAERTLNALTNGAIMLNEAREILGRPPLPEGDVLYVPTSKATPTDPAELLAPPEPQTIVEELPPGGTPPQPPNAAGRQFFLVKATEGDSLGDQIDALRDELEADTEAIVLHALEAQQRIILERLMRKQQSSDEDLIPDEAEPIAAALLVTLFLRALRGMHTIVQKFLKVGFELDERATADFLRAAGKQIHNIDATTRKAVADALRAGVAAGEGQRQLAQRIEQLGAFSPERAKMIARTEVANATNAAALFTYKQSGMVVGIRVSDGDYDRTCADMNGRTFRLENAPSSLEHPNCRRQFHPLTDPAQLTGAA